MSRLFYSLQTKLITSFVLLIVVIAGGTFFYTFSETKNALKETMRDELKAVASVVATQLDGDLLSSIKIGDESTEAFIIIRNQLLSIRNSNPDIKFVYTMRLENGKAHFVVDADYGQSDDAALIGDIYEETNQQLIDGFSFPSADDNFTFDEWGSVLSGYAPVKNSAGVKVAMVGIDMDSERVIGKQNFIGNTIYVIMGISILIAGIIIGAFSLTIIRDIKKLNHTANEISKGNSEVTIDIKRKDEIGELANSFSRMVASLKFMMMDMKDRD